MSSCEIALLGRGKGEGRTTCAPSNSIVNADQAVEAKRSTSSIPGGVGRNQGRAILRIMASTRLLSPSERVVLYFLWSPTGSEFSSCESFAQRFFGRLEMFARPARLRSGKKNRQGKSMAYAIFGERFEGKGRCLEQGLRPREMTGVTKQQYGCGVDCPPWTGLRWILR